tara:strand:- start:400 stop:729 length:330 start_codon:yes stop_codon:yes gene_type:complete
MEEEISDCSDCSADSVCACEVLQMVLEDRLCYLCKTTDGTEEIFDRSDLMDGGDQQRLVFQFERRNPPPWDEVCRYCEGEGCEECICDCERACRHINGVNYGCPKHPVV